MKIKICGLKYANNIEAVSKLNVDFLGFIFYKNSPRVVTELPDCVKKLPQKRVGVFVNDTIENIMELKQKYNLDFIQLHGNEDVRFTKRINDYTNVIKAFSIDEYFNFKYLNKYKDIVSHFLFDTESKSYGGSGKKFDWNILVKYILDVPFFLSGGIAENDADKIKNLNLKTLYGVDINSCFEDNIGIKNIQKIKKFSTTLRT